MIGAQCEREGYRVVEHGPSNYYILYAYGCARTRRAPCARDEKVDGKREVIHIVEIQWGVRNPDIKYAFTCGSH